jgi:nitroreductase
MLAATALGLSSCWIGAFDPKKVAEVIQCPRGVVPIPILTIAYADEEPECTTRRAISDLVHLVK